MSTASQHSPDQRAPKALLSLRDVAELTTLSYSTVKALVARGVIRSVTVGRRRLVHYADLEAWADGLRSQESGHEKNIVERIPLDCRAPPATREPLERVNDPAGNAGEDEVRAPISPSTRTSEEALSEKHPSNLS
jgi:excisionase family DNA binding protein